MRFFRIRPSHVFFPPGKPSQHQIQYGAVQRLRVRDDRGVRDNRGVGDNRGVRDDRGVCDNRGVRDDRGVRDNRGVRDDRGVRDNRGVNSRWKTRGWGATTSARQPELHPPRCPFNPPS